MSAQGLLLEHNRNWTSSMTEKVDELPWKLSRKWVRRFFWTKTCTSTHSSLVRQALRRS